jgi:hypothetical protein
MFPLCLRVFAVKMIEVEALKVERICSAIRKKKYFCGINKVLICQNFPICKYSVKI